MPTSPHADAHTWDQTTGSAPELQVPAGHVRIIRTVDDVYEPYETPETTVANEYSTAPGMPARGVIVISAASTLGCAALDVALTGGLSMFFDLCFVVICLVGAMAVRPRDLFTAGVLAPLVFGGTIAVVAALAPDLLAPQVGISQAFLTGLADHAGGLVAGYAVALVTVAGRVSARRQRATA
jgi:hypothetical protein